MSRGAEQQQQQLANQASQRSQQQADQTQQGMRALANNSLIPGYQNMISNGGYTQPEKTAITGQSMGAINSAYDAASSNALNRVARTNNDAGYTGLADKLAMDRGKEVADTTQRNQIAFGDAARQDRESGLRGLAGVYGVDENTLRAQLGLGPAYLGIGQQAAAGQHNQGSISLGPLGNFGFAGS